MLYIRRIFHQDTTHQMTADRDGSKIFFEYDYSLNPQDRIIDFEYIDFGNHPDKAGQHIDGILHPDSSESRINGGFKNYVFNILGAVEKDFLLIWNSPRNNTKYKFTHIDNSHSWYNLLCNLIDNKNHLLTTQQTTSSLSPTLLTLFSTELNSKYRPYITAIKSKPFLLLAGISGTGKSRIVRELARACWDEDSDEYKAHKPRNYEMVQVKPNWHDSSELIGYVSRVSGTPVYIAGDFLKFVAKAWEEPEVPYFLCLDEMNLAPVEQYFAEYLSVVESRKVNEDGEVVTDPILKKSSEDWYRVLTSELTSNDEVRERFLNDGICIPQNLIVVGTVNMDETTFSFSRKVLDRAMTIEMNEVNLEGGLTEHHERIGKLSAAELIGTAVEGVDVYEDNKGICDLVIDYLKAVNEILDGTPFKIAYRTRNEFLLYVVNNLPYNKDESGEELDQNYIIARALDEITNMKILSRIEGDETKVSAQFLDELKETIKAGLDKIQSDLFESEVNYKSISLAKLDEMTSRLSSGYTSFWS